jgi:hypothetical protein
MYGGVPSKESLKAMVVGFGQVILGALGLKSAMDQGDVTKAYNEPQSAEGDESKHPSPEGGRIIVDPNGNGSIEPAGGRTVGRKDGKFIETQYPNGSPAQQLHSPEGEVPHGHCIVEFGPSADFAECRSYDVERTMVGGNDGT